MTDVISRDSTMDSPWVLIGLEFSTQQLLPVQLARVDIANKRKCVPLDTVKTVAQRKAPGMGVAHLFTQMTTHVTQFSAS